MDATKPRLGRGLDALLSSGGINGVNATLNSVSVGRVPVGQIRQNPYQPRKRFDDDELKQLTDSVKVHGVLQPLVVRQAGSEYQLIAGERRLRAAQAAGLGEVPVHVVEFDDQQVFEAALVENIQRSDLNPIEKAQGFKEYIDRYAMTKETLGQRLGLDRSTVSNLVGLLNLPAEVQDAVRLGQLSLGHAKVIKGVADPERQVQLCRETIFKHLTVSALEQLAREAKAEAADQPEPNSRTVVMKTAHVQGLEDELRQKLSVRVEIKVKAKEKGQVVLGFDTNDDFERIMDTLRK